MQCVACGKYFDQHNPAEIFCGKYCFRNHGDEVVWVGHTTCANYDYFVVSKTREDAEQKIVAEWKRQVRILGTEDDFDDVESFDDIDFDYLNQWNGTSVRAALMGKAYIEN